MTLNNCHGFIDIFSLGLGECDLVPLTENRTWICCFLLSYRIKQFRNVLQHFKRWTSVNDILFGALTKCHWLLIWLDFDCMCCFWLPPSEKFMNENVYIILSVLTCDLSFFSYLAFMYVSNTTHIHWLSTFFSIVSLISFALLPCSPFSILLVAFLMQNLSLSSYI